MGWFSITSRLREDLPHKPHPDAILNIMRKFSVPVRQTLMIGDYLYDLQTAAAAGVDSVLFCSKTDFPDFADMATYRIRRLCDLLGICEPAVREAPFNSTKRATP